MQEPNSRPRWCHIDYHDTCRRRQLLSPGNIERHAPGSFSTGPDRPACHFMLASPRKRTGGRPRQVRHQSSHSVWPLIAISAFCQSERAVHDPPPSRSALRRTSDFRWRRPPCPGSSLRGNTGDRAHELHDEQAGRLPNVAAGPGRGRYVTNCWHRCWSF